MEKRATKDKVQTTQTALNQYFKLNNVPAYTEAQVQQMANNYYKPQYNASVQGAQQQHKLAVQGLQNQLSKLQSDYNRSKQTLAQNIDSTYRSADRQSLSRGMQRSSFNNANLNNINLSGVKQQNALAETATMAKNEVNKNISLSSQNLGEILNRLKTDYSTNVGNYADKLRKERLEQVTQYNNAYNQLQLQLMRLDPNKFGIVDQNSGSDTSYSGGGGYKSTTKPKNDKSNFNIDSELQSKINKAIAAASQKPVTYTQYKNTKNHGYHHWSTMTK